MLEKVGFCWRLAILILLLVKVNSNRINYFDFNHHLLLKYEEKYEELVKVSVHKWGTESLPRLGQVDTWSWCMGFMLSSSNGPTVNHTTVVTQSITYTENHLSPPLLGPWFLPSFFNKNTLWRIITIWENSK